MLCWDRGEQRERTGIRDIGGTDLLLDSELVGVTTLPLPAVRGSDVQTSVALPADLLVRAVLPCEDLHRGVDLPTQETAPLEHGHTLLQLGLETEERLPSHGESLSSGRDSDSGFDLSLESVQGHGLGVQVQDQGGTGDVVQEDLHPLFFFFVFSSWKCSVVAARSVWTTRDGTEGGKRKDNGKKGVREDEDGEEGSDPKGPERLRKKVTPNTTALPQPLLLSPPEQDRKMKK